MCCSCCSRRSAGRRATAGRWPRWGTPRPEPAPPRRRRRWPGARARPAPPRRRPAAMSSTATPSATQPARESVSTSSTQQGADAPPCRVSRSRRVRAAPRSTSANTIATATNIEYAIGWPHEVSTRNDSPALRSECAQIAAGRSGAEVEERVAEAHRLGDRERASARCRRTPESWPAFLERLAGGDHPAAEVRRTHTHNCEVASFHERGPSSTAITIERDEQGDADVDPRERTLPARDRPEGQHDGQHDQGMTRAGCMDEVQLHRGRVAGNRHEPDRRGRPRPRPGRRKTSVPKQATPGRPIGHPSAVFS